MGRKATDREREAVALRMDGLTYEEIGKAMGVSKQRAEQMVREGVSSAGYNRSCIAASRCVFPKIREWMLENGYTGTMLAQDIGVNAATACRILKGHDGRYSTYKAIADRMGMTVTEAFSHDE